jgi:hypothetical protein
MKDVIVRYVVLLGHIRSVNVEKRVIVCSVLCFGSLTWRGPPILGSNP